MRYIRYHGGRPIPGIWVRFSGVKIRIKCGVLPLTLIVFGGYEQESKVDSFTHRNGTRFWPLPTVNPLISMWELLVSNSEMSPAMAGQGQGESRPGRETYPAFSGTAQGNP